MYVQKQTQKQKQRSIIELYIQSRKNNTIKNTILHIHI
jgi:hypothetical protein